MALSASIHTPQPRKDNHHTSTHICEVPITNYADPKKKKHLRICEACKGRMVIFFLVEISKHYTNNEPQQAMRDYHQGALPAYTQEIVDNRILEIGGVGELFKSNKLKRFRKLWLQCAKHVASTLSNIATERKMEKLSNTTLENPLEAFEWWKNCKHEIAETRSARSIAPSISEYTVTTTTSIQSDPFSEALAQVSNTPRPSVAADSGYFSPPPAGNEFASEEIQDALLRLFKCHEELLEAKKVCNEAEGAKRQAELYKAIGVEDHDVKKAVERWEKTMAKVVDIESQIEEISKGLRELEHWYEGVI